MTILYYVEAILEAKKAKFVQPATRNTRNWGLVRIAAMHSGLAPTSPGATKSLPAVMGFEKILSSAREKTEPGRIGLFHCFDSTL
jgi:hypothetical protein